MAGWVIVEWEVPVPLSLVILFWVGGSLALTRLGTPVFGGSKAEKLRPKTTNRRPRELRASPFCRADFSKQGFRKTLSHCKIPDSPAGKQRKKYGNRLTAWKYQEFWQWQFAFG